MKLFKGPDTCFLECCGPEPGSCVCEELEKAKKITKVLKKLSRMRGGLFSRWVNKNNKVLSENRRGKNEYDSSDSYDDKRETGQER